eukprot:CAMPEP_0183338066 /NCGR_PEP_ID=MMETSP0164_2-20130417/5491_1 /TAXON_ID=221442 /ORGANISM="Coccolithus pelagicus ssp braarudi, Strain PLY182g" /LENGTH=167 /DNA_ID=CAMNT_0025507849 /DNA_START=593 /DNA_END=1098 /DNA_ORIENTATION=+
MRQRSRRIASSTPTHGVITQKTICTYHGDAAATSSRKARRAPVRDASWATASASPLEVDDACGSDVGDIFDALGTLVSVSVAALDVRDHVTGLNVLETTLDSFGYIAGIPFNGGAQTIAHLHQASAKGREGLAAHDACAAVCEDSFLKVGCVVAELAWGHMCQAAVL